MNLATDQMAVWFIASSESQNHAVCVVLTQSHRYLLQNMDWLDEELGGYEDDYLIIDCPGESKQCSLCPRGENS